MLSVSLSLSAAVSAQTKKRDISPSAEKRFRQELTRALVAPAEARGRAAKKLSATAKKLEKKYSFESLIRALRAGPVRPNGVPKPRRTASGRPEKLTRYGSVVTGFAFAVDGASYRYAVDVPESYTGEEPVPLLIDPGHGTGAKKDQKGKADFLPFYRNMATRAPSGERWLIARTEIVEQIGADGIGPQGALPEDAVARVFDAFLHDIAVRFHVDLDRIYVAGLSQTGFWAWYLAKSLPDRFAGAAPMSSVTWQVNRYLPNLRHVPVSILHGELDRVCPASQSRRTFELLEKLEFPVTYEEVSGAAHDGRVWGRLGGVLGKLSETPRTLYPKKIEKNVQTTKTPWCYWVRVDKLDKVGDGKAASRPTASLKAEIEGQRILVQSEGVKRMTLALSRELLDLDEPIRVVWNGKTKRIDRPKRDFARSVVTAIERGDWARTFEGFVTLGGR